MGFDEGQQETLTSTSLAERTSSTSTSRQPWCINVHVFIKIPKIVKLQVPVQVRSSPVRSSPVQVQSGPDLDLDLDKTKGPGLTLKSCRPPPPTHYPPHNF